MKYSRVYCRFSLPVVEFKRTFLLGFMSFGRLGLRDLVGTLSLSLCVGKKKGVFLAGYLG